MLHTAVSFPISLTDKGEALWHHLLVSGVPMPPFQSHHGKSHPKCDSHLCVLLTGGGVPPVRISAPLSLLSISFPLTQRRHLADIGQPIRHNGYLAVQILFMRVCLPLSIVTTTCKDTTRSNITKKAPTRTITPDKMPPRKLSYSKNWKSIFVMFRYTSSKQIK
jgi:hypothetical protein